MERVKKGGVTLQAELDKARRSMLASQFSSSLESTKGQASDLGGNWLLTKNVNFSKDYLDEIAKVTPADLQRVANKYLRDDHANVTSPQSHWLSSPARKPRSRPTKAPR